MKREFLALFFSLLATIVNAQKKRFELDAAYSWPKVNGAVLSPDAEFASFNIDNYPLGSHTLVIKSTSGSWERRYQYADGPTFSDDGRFFLAKLPNDTLLAINLQNKSIFKTPATTRYNIIKINSVSYILNYCQRDSNLKLSKPDGTIVRKFSEVINYELATGNDRLVIKRRALVGCKNCISVFYVDLKSFNEKKIYQGNDVSDIIFDNSGSQVCFMTTVGAKPEIWHYKTGESCSKLLVSSKLLADTTNVVIGGRYYKFSKSGDRLFFSIKGTPRKNDKGEPEIWSYKDSFLKSFYFGNNFERPQNPREYLSNIDVKNGTITQLLRGSESEIAFASENDSVLLVKSSFGHENEFWNKEARITYTACNTVTGEKVIIEKDCKGPMNVIELSPSGKYAVYYDAVINAYCSYEIASGRKLVLTKDFPGKAFADYRLQGYPSTYSLGREKIVGWLGSDKQILVQGTYDIWLLDPDKRRPPENLTNGIGKTNKTVFSLAIKNPGQIQKEDGTLLLKAFNILDKRFGFYSLSLYPKKALKLLSMQPMYIEGIEHVYPELSSDVMVSAKKCSGFILRLETVNDYPNYYFSRSLERFKIISSLQPQKQYWWSKSELHTYKDSVGKCYQGILYKPEDFNPKNKYPVIMDIYEEKSNLLNSFPDAEPSGGEISIPHLLSRGYLVFLPDVKKERYRYAGDDVVQSVHAAVNHLKSFSWVNENKFGICGGSTGGWEVNYIITHSKIFSAAISMCGISDMISQATQLRDGISHINSLSGFGHMLGATLFEDTEAYIKNSPILMSRNVSTPLLLLHNELDQAVLPIHSRSFFLALRDLQKKVWWLNYKSEGHGLGRRESRLDFHSRAIQFWDHFLKDAPEPQWIKDALSSQPESDEDFK
ncbi:prolyl oligopeptidase family serine peptidase [Pedobacter sp. JY14-1]|uniref:alpha/beta hydrolase family protein n=1 Tax=Pedobacter sp. JY14-1 TaxID=3034151 RepID=UPI0023E1B6C5|nr:prolyl oligopeptidase family serine peptidase [Pedobacter sp. JY14-1]